MNGNNVCVHIMFIPLVMPTVLTVDYATYCDLYIGWDIRITIDRLICILLLNLIQDTKRYSYKLHKLI